MICTLCLKTILEDESSVKVNGRLRHKECSDQLEKMVEELDEIYQETKPDDI